MNRLVNLTGLLLPEDFDENGGCISVNLSVGNELVYAVRDETKGRNLESFLRQPVRIHGRLRVCKGRPQITVLKVCPQD